MDFQMIVDSIAYNFNVLMSNKEKPYYNKSLVIGNEQLFLEKGLKKGEMGIVLSFGEGSVNYGQVILPVSLMAIGFDSEINVTQQLLFDFSNTYNNTKQDGVFQWWNAPSKVESFVPFGIDVKALWTIRGSLNVSVGNVESESYYIYGEGEEDKEYIKLEQIELSFSNSPVPEATYTSEGINETINAMQTRTFTVVMNMLAGSKLIYDVMSNINLINKTYTFRHVYHFDFGEVFFNETYTLTNSNITKRLGDNIAISLTFTR